MTGGGLAGEELQDALTFLDEQELVGGIVGSHADHHSAPYSLTEEFVAVYRMHPLIPDEVAFHSLATGRLLEKQPLAELAGRKTPPLPSAHDARSLLFVRDLSSRSGDAA